MRILILRVMGQNSRSTIYAPDIPVHAHGEHADIANDGILAAGEFLPHLDPLGGLREAIEVAAGNAGFLKLVAHVLGVNPIDGKAQGRPAGAMLAPSGNDVRHERRLVHRRAEVALVVVAGRCTDAFELGMGGSDPRPLVAIERESGSVSDMFCTPCLRSMVTTAYRPASVAERVGT
jgi:hypothetical protein